ncbi:MAG: Cna B-type domain-containing protein, partial [Peptococcaceae bacterium]|nr:Cna B-type domain-containing protein [Peptococcaceae bacterium]
QLFDEVTLAPGTVTYKFENLDSYDLTDGHMYQYQLAERKVDGYVPSYEMNVDGKDRIIDITNTYTDEEQFVTISGEKKWIAPEGTVLPTSVIVELYQNGEAIDEVEITADMNWQYSFDGLAMYDEDGVAYSYTVKEVPIDGYLSLVVPTANGYDITNTLYVGEAGQFSVSKAVSGGDQMVPADDTVYGFLLKVKATVNEWDSMKVYQKSELEDARDEALEELNAANEELARAERLFRQNAVAFTTGSAYQFIMVEEVYYDEPEVTTGSAYDYTTGSAYKYTIVDNDGDILVKRSTTSSALFMDFTPAADAADAITRIIDAIKALADDFKNLNKASVFLNMLNEEQQSSTPSALKFNRTDAEDLLQAERDVREADALVAATEQAIADFIAADVTTPSAIKITMTPTAGSGLEAIVMELDTDSALYDAETMTYAINFELLKDTGYVVTIEAADKAEIEYSISEIDWAFENYVGTEITVNGIEELEGRYVAPREMDKASADTYLFNNIYEDNPPPPPPPPVEPDPEDPPYYPPYVPPVVPEEPPVIPDEPDVPEEPVVIEEPEVPLVDIPGEIIEEEDIPLGDAPPTGDNTNAVPFMVMMALAAAGLVITRRRFN